VRGPVEAADLGITLVHEHVLVDFVGADKVGRHRYEAEDAFRLRQQVSTWWPFEDPLMLELVAVPGKAASLATCTATGRPWRSTIAGDGWT